MKFILCALFLMPGLASAASYVSTESVQVCIIPLPVFETARLNRLLMNTKHIYIKVSGKTYGTPYTIRHTYFGGDAYLYSEDMYARQPHLVRDEVCYPVQRPEDLDDKKFSEAVECIAEKMKAPGKGQEDLRTWFAVFDYHGLNNNCGSMADYLVRCGGGKINRLFNYSVGDRVPSNKRAKIQSLVDSSDVQISNYGEICEKALSECTAP